MRKFFSTLGVVLMTIALASPFLVACGDDDPDPSKGKYDLTVSVTLPADVEQAEIESLYLVITKNGSSQTVEMAAVEMSKKLNLTMGSYSVSAVGKLSGDGERVISGTADIYLTKNDVLEIPLSVTFGQLKLTVNAVVPEAAADQEIESLKVTVTDAEGNATEAPLEGTTVYEGWFAAGQYTVSVEGYLVSDRAARPKLSGSIQVDLFADNSVDVNLSLSNESPLLFKTIYSTGGAQYYVLDSYIEIVNNSDEVQYLDNLVLAAPLANQKAESAWQTAYPEKYNGGQGTVLAFPGSGTDYPLQPGEFVVVADQAMNHKLAYGDDETKIDEFAKSPDLSGADFEKYYGNGDVDNEDVPNMQVVFSNNAYMKMWAFGVMGRAYILAKLPEGTTPDAFAADSTNYSTYPGTTASTQYLMIPSKYVLDAVEIFASSVDPEDNYPFFLPEDDLKGVQGSDTYVGQAVRRKVSRIENGRVYYQDTNNSSNDFKNKQDNTPGVTPTEVD